MNRFKNLVVALLATLLLTALPQTAWAAEPTTTWDEATGTLTFVADGTSDEVILPTEYNTADIKEVIIESGYTSIGNRAFYGCSNLSSVTLPASVTSIGDRAFYKCSNLGSVTLPASEVSIGQYAFADCSNLSSVTIPDGITSIGTGMFNNCSSLSSVTLPTSVTSIGESAFYGCSNLRSVTIPNSVTSIAERAFTDCSSLTSISFPDGITSIANYTLDRCSNLVNVTIPNSVISIGEDVFFGCESLTTITIPNSVKTIGNGAFGGCRGLTSITIPDGVTSIGERVFVSCTGLTSISLPNSITNIGNSAFYNCTNLTSITIPNSVTSLKEDLFAECSSLTSITIPNSVKSIAVRSFYGCIKLTDVYYGGTETQWNQVAIALENDHLLNATIHYDNTGSGETPIVPPIGGECGENLTWTLADGILTISGTGDKWDWLGLVPWSEEASTITSVIIESGVTSIRSYAFSNCSNLTSITIPNSITRIEGGAFSGCGRLKEISIPTSVTTIGDNAFQGCEGLTNITIPNGVTSIGKSMFSGCTSLRSILIPNSVTTIEATAFHSCEGLTNITIPNSVTSIGDSAFMSCSNLTTVTMSDNITSIGDFAFGYCENLISIVIPNGVTSIVDRTFYNCSGLTNVTIPDSVTSIGFAAFGSMSRLTDVYYGGTEAQWNQINIDNTDNENDPLLNATIHYQDDGEEPVSYTVTQSIGTPDNSNPPRYIVTGERDEVLICNGPLTEFQALYLDGRALARGTDYTVQGSSVTPGVDDEVQGGLVPVQSRAGTEPETVITIAKACFQPQDNNVHTIAAEFRTADGTVQRASQNFYYPTQPDPEMVTLPAGVKYVPYSWRPEQTEGTYSVVAGTLPNGLRVNGETGEVTGVPMVSGSWNFTVRHQGADTAYSLTIEDNTNTAVQQPNDYPITTPVGTPSPSDPNQFILYEYTDRVLIIDGPYDEFMHLRIDGQLLTRDEDYSARSGSTVITIFGQTFEKFGEGTHTLSAEFRENKDPNGKLKTVSQNYTVNLTRPNQPSQPGNTGSSGSSGSSSSNKRPSANLPKPVTPGTSGTSSTSSTPSSTTPSTTTPSTPSTTPSTPSTPAEQTPVATGLPFGDVSADSWYFEDVKWAYEGEIMTGETETSFGPQHQISQATIVTVLARLGKIDLTQYDGAADSSIAAGKWYTNAALWAKQSGILPDYSEFTGEETITRDQMAIMLVKYLRSMGNNTTPPVQPAAFADADLMSQDGNDAFQVLYAYNIFRGVGSGKMDPAGATTRAQFAALVHRVAEAA